MSPTRRRRLAALEARLGKREQQLRRRHVWWDAHRGEPEPVAEPGEELHVYRWMRPGEELTSEAAGAGGEAAPRWARRHERQRRAAP
jgi:hypothetical protein